jgi:hypothetical protein
MVNKAHECKVSDALAQSVDAAFRSWQLRQSLFSRHPPGTELMHHVFDGRLRELEAEWQQRNSQKLDLGSPLADVFEYFDCPEFDEIDETYNCVVNKEVDIASLAGQKMES